MSDPRSTETMAPWVASRLSGPGAQYVRRAEWAVLGSNQSTHSGHRSTRAPNPDESRLVTSVRDGQRMTADDTADRCGQPPCERNVDGKAT